jgi:hypothetical protein
MTERCESVRFARNAPWTGTANPMRIDVRCGDSPLSLGVTEGYRMRWIRSVAVVRQAVWPET